MKTQFKTDDGYMLSILLTEEAEWFTDGVEFFEVGALPTRVDGWGQSVPVPLAGVETLDGVLFYDGNVFRVEMGIALKVEVEP